MVCSSVVFFKDYEIRLRPHFLFTLRKKRGAVVLAESAVVEPVTGYFQRFVIMELELLSATVAQSLHLTAFLKSSLSIYKVLTSNVRTTAAESISCVINGFKNHQTDIKYWVSALKFDLFQSFSALILA